MSTDKRLEFYKEKIKSELLKVKGDIGDLRYKLYTDMVDSCDDYEELKEMAELEMQLQTIEYTRNAIREKLNEQQVSIQDIRKVYCETYDNSEEELEEDDDFDSEEMSALLALQIQRRLEEEPLEEKNRITDLDNESFLTDEEKIANALLESELEDDNEDILEEMYGNTDIEEDTGEDDDIDEEFDMDELRAMYGDIAEEEEDIDEGSFDIDNLDESDLEMLSVSLMGENDEYSDENEDEFEINDDDIEEFLDSTDEYSGDDTFDFENSENDEVNDDMDNSDYIDLDNIDAIDESMLFMSAEDDIDSEEEEQDEFDIDSDDLFAEDEEDEDSIDDDIDEDDLFLDSDEDEEGQLLEMYGDTSDGDDIEEFSAEDCIDLDDPDSINVDDMFGDDIDEDIDEQEEDGIDLDNIDSIDVDDMFGDDIDEDEEEDFNTGYSVDELDNIDVDEMFGPDEDEYNKDGGESYRNRLNTIKTQREANGLPHVTFKNTNHSAETQETFETVGNIIGKLGLAGFKGMNKVKKKINNSDFYKLPKED